MHTEPTIYIVDDDDAVRKSTAVVTAGAGFKTLTYASAEEFLSAFDNYACGCLILDLRLKKMSGLELLAQLRELGCRLPALIVSGHGDVPVAVKSIKLGAYDFLQKPVQPDVLIAKVEEALAQSHAADLAQHLPDNRADRLRQLTPRELDILRQLIAGRSSKQIAYDMNLSLKTVSNHRAHLLAKTGAENTADLVRIAITSGLST